MLISDDMAGDSNLTDLPQNVKQEPYAVDMPECPSRPVPFRDQIHQALAMPGYPATPWAVRFGWGKLFMKPRCGCLFGVARSPFPVDPINLLREGPEDFPE